MQTDWSLLKEMFDQICSRYHCPQIDMFATMYNKMLTISHVSEYSAWPVNAFCVTWEGLNLYALALVSFMGNVVNKIMTHYCWKVILIDSGWSKIPWFWDLGYTIVPDTTIPSII